MDDNGRIRAEGRWALRARLWRNQYEELIGAAGVGREGVVGSADGDAAGQARPGDWRSEAGGPVQDKGAVIGGPGKDDVRRAGREAQRHRRTEHLDRHIRRVVNRLPNLHRREAGIGERARGGRGESEHREGIADHREVIADQAGAEGAG